VEVVGSFESRTSSSCDWSISIKSRIKAGKTENDASAPQLCRVLIMEGTCNKFAEIGKIPFVRSVRSEFVAVSSHRTAAVGSMEPSIIYCLIR